ncbi:MULTISPECIES: DUF4375 domain-containing protein [unclassified Eikenella]|uniref:DMP19 family protein n=1 Tax=unclassified Eikenella TaxID=2639367 RepID=UPI0009ED26A3|nr:MULTISPECIES: DUF4375 domain-containing protein [unclassified Eikenella]VDH00751.1 Uncharacterised protein [Helicobacter pametensis]
MPDNMMTINQMYRMLNVWTHRIRHSDRFIERYSGAQRALLAYLSLDLLMEDDGFVVLIADGRGEHALAPETAEYLRQWGVRDTPDIIDRARALHQQHGATIQTATPNSSIEKLRIQFPQFDELDADYCLVCEDDFCTVCSYIRRHPAEFAELTAAAGESGSPMPPLDA